MYSNALFSTISYAPRASFKLQNLSLHTFRLKFAPQDVESLWYNYGMNCTRSQIVTVLAVSLLITGAWIILLSKSSHRSSNFSCAYQSYTANMPLSGPWTVHRPKWILFGDSLTERSLGFGGWGSSLAHQYYRRIDVVNRGELIC